MKTRKLFSKLFLFVLVLATAFTVAACGDTETPGPSDEKTVESVTIDPTTAAITVGEELTYSDFKITVRYSDETTQEVTLTESMISGDDLAKLGTVGTHALTVTVMGKTTTLTVTVAPKTLDTVSLADVTKTYDGVRVTPQVTGLPLNAQVDYAYYTGTTADENNKVAEMVDAGTYFVKATVSLTGYETKEVTATVVINKKHIAADSLHWSNTGYVHTGSEITLNATADDLPEGFTVTFEDENGDPAKATDKGYYTAIARFEGTNKNYTIDATCQLTWRILASAAVDLEPWYGAKAGQLLTATFVKGTLDNDVTMTFGDDVVSGTVAYDGANATVTVPGYTVTVTDGVMTIEKESETTYLIAASELAQYVGEYSTIVEDFTVALDTAAGTLSFTQAGKGEQPVVNQLTLDVVDGTVQLTVDGTDMALTYAADMQRVKLDGYANPADFNQADSDGIYLLTKAEADDFIDSLPVGAFTDYQAQNVLEIAADKSVMFNGNPVQPYGVFVDYYGTKEARFYISLSTNKREKQFIVYDGFCSLEISYSAAMFVPAEYKNYFGTYYTKNADGTALNTSEKVSFMEYEGYYRITVGSTNYETTKGEIAFTSDGTTLTATLTKTDSDPVIVTFNGGTSVTVNTTQYVKAKTLFSTSTSAWFYNPANGKYIIDRGNGKIAIYGTDYLYKSLEYTATGLKITVDVDGTDKSIEYNNDARYVIYDGVVHVSDSIGSVSNGKASSGTYYHGEDTIAFTSAFAYTLTVDGTAKTLTDVVLSIVDDGNDNGRTVIQAKGKLDGVDCTIVHYSLATVYVDGVAYAHSNYKDIMGSEFKPSADSVDVFTFGTDGKMTFRGTEIFLNGTNTYTNFNFADNYFYSIDINTTRVQFHDQINWNIKYYFAAYFDFNGAYVSADNTKVFYFDDEMVAYNDTTTSSFTVMTTATGAEMTLSGKTAVFTKVAGGANTVEYDGVTYTKVVGFDFADYYGEYTAFDGSANGVAVSFTAATVSSGKVSIRKLVMYDGQIVPVIYFGYNSYYLIPNTDAATAAQLPVLAVYERFASFPKATTFNGKPLTVQIKAVQKAGGTGYMPSVSVVYDGQESTLNFQYGTYSTEIGGVKYILDINEDAATQEQLPVLVYEAWWDDFAGSYTYNGKTTKVEIVVDTSGTSPVPALQFTFEDEVVTVEMTDDEVAAGVKRIEFTTADSKQYVGILNANATPDVAVYSREEFAFFFAANNTTTVNGAELVLVANSASGGTTFDLTMSTYDGKALTNALYLPADDVFIFVTADDTYAYDLVAKQFWQGIIAADDAPLLGLNYTSTASYGQPLYNTKIISEITAFDKTTGKASLTVKTGGSWSQSAVTSITKVAGTEGEYLVVGKTYNSSSTDVTMYLLIDGTNVTLVMAEEYLFPGTYTVDGKSLVIAKSGTSYTAAYDTGEAVAITPDFSARKFMLETTDVTYMVTWTYDTDTGFTFTLTEVTADILAFVGYSGSTYITDYVTNLYDLDITFTGYDSNNKATYTIEWEYGYSGSGTVTGTLSDDGQSILVSTKINYNTMTIYLNKDADTSELKYVMLSTSCTASKLMGKFAVDGKEVVIGVDAVPEYDEDDYLDGYTPKFSVTVDGVAATVATAWSTSASSIEFTCGNVTYTATYADGTVTVVEQAA